MRQLSRRRMMAWRLGSARKLDYNTRRFKMMRGETFERHPPTAHGPIDQRECQ